METHGDQLGSGEAPRGQAREVLFLFYFGGKTNGGIKDLRLWSPSRSWILESERFLVFSFSIPFVLSTDWESQGCVF